MRLLVLMTCVSALRTAAGAQAPSLTTALGAPAHRTVFVPPNTIVQIGDIGIFVDRRRAESMSIQATTSTPLKDTLRLKTEARTVAAAYRSLAQGRGAKRVSVVFEFASKDIKVDGVTRPEVWAVDFVRGPDGRWTEEKKPKRALHLDVVP